MSALGIIDVKQTPISYSAYHQSSELKVATRANNQDNANFSPTALENLNAAKNNSFSMQRVTTADSNNIPVDVNFSASSIKYGNSVLDLKEFGNITKDDIAVERLADGSFRVVNMTKKEELAFDAAGNPRMVADSSGEFVLDIQDFAGTLDSINNALIINNKNLAIEAGAGNDIIINRASNVSIIAGAGDDKIFNLNSTVRSIDLGTGASDAIYTVGLSNTLISAEQTNAYIKTTGTISAATILLGSGTNFVDAAGRSIINNTKIISSDNGVTTSGTNAVIAGSLSNSSIDLDVGNVAVDIGTITSSSLKFGAGNNSLVSKSISGVGTTISAESGKNTFDLGTVSRLKLEGSSRSDAIKVKSTVDSQFNLGEGVNSFDAGTQGKLMRTDITADAASSTSIQAGSFQGNSAKNNITLGNGNNNIEFSGTVQNANIILGEGNTVSFTAQNITKASLSSQGNVNDVSGSGSRTIDIKGNVNELDYAGSSDSETFTIGGKLNSSNILLGAGVNMLSAGNSITASQIVAEGTTTTDSTSIYGKSFSGKGKGQDDIILGSGTNLIQIDTAITDSKINLRTGRNIINAGSIVGKKHGVSFDATDNSNSQTLTVSGGAVKLKYLGGSGSDTLTFAGAISNSSLELGEGTNTLIAEKKGKGQTLTNVNIKADGSSSNTIKVGKFASTGTNSNSLVLGDGGNKLEIEGNITGGAVINLGTGANTFTVGSVLGKANNTVKIIAGGANSSNNQTITIKGNASHLDYIGSSGADTLTVEGTVNYLDADFGEGMNSLVAEKNGKAQNISQSTINAAGSSSATHIVGKSMLSSVVKLGDGGNTITLEGNISGKNSDIDLGTGANTLVAQSLIGTKASNINIKAGGEGTEAQNITFSGSASYLNYSGGSGADSLSFAAEVKNSNINLGDGTNALSLVNAKGKSQNLINTNIDAQGTDGSTSIYAKNFSSNPSINGVGSKITLGDGGNTVNLEGNISGKEVVIDLGSGANTLDAKSVSGSKNSAVVIKAGGTETNAQNVTVHGTSTLLSYQGGLGADNLIVEGVLRNSVIDLNDGVNTLKAIKDGKDQKLENVTITAMGSASSTSITAGQLDGKLSSITLGDGDHNISFSKNVNAGSINLGAGNSTFSAFTFGRAGAGVSLESSGALTMNVNDIKSANVKNIGTSALSLSVNKMIDKSSIDAGESGAITVNAGTLKSSQVLLGGGSSALTFGTVTGTLNNKSKIGNAEDVTMGSSSLTVLGHTNLLDYNAKSSNAHTVNFATVQDSDINLGSGANTLNADSIGYNSNNILGKGNVNINVADIGTSGTAGTTTITIRDAVSNLTYTGNAGNDNVYIKGNILNSKIDLGEGSNELAGGTGGLTTGVVRNSTIIGKGDANTIAIDSFIVDANKQGSLNLSGTGATTLISNGVVNGTVNLNSTKNSVTFGNTVTGTLNVGMIDSPTTNNITFSAGLSNANVNIGNTASSNTVELKGNTKDSTINMTLGDKNTFNSTGALSISNSNINIGNTSQTSSNNVLLNADIKNTVINIGSGLNTVSAHAGINAGTKANEKLTINFNGDASTSNTFKTDSGFVSNVNVNLGAGTSNMTMTNSSLNNVNITSQGTAKVSAKAMDKVTTAIGGVNSLLTAKHILDSNITMTGTNASIGSADTRFEKTDIRADRTITIEGTSFNTGSITLSDKSNNIKISSAITNASINLIGNDNVIGVAGSTTAKGTVFDNVNVTSKGDSTLVQGDRITGGNINLGGGSNTIAVDSNISKASISLEGASNNIGGTHGVALNDVKISATGDKTHITADKITGGEINLQGKENKLDIASSISNSKINIAQKDNTIGGKSTVYNNNTINIAGENTTLLGSRVSGSNINLNGSNKLEITDSFSDSTVNINGGNNTIGDSANGLTSYYNTDINITGGTNSIHGSNMSGGSLVLGGDNNNIDITTSFRDTTIHLNGSNNNLGSTHAMYVNTDITALGDKTHILGQSMSGGKIDLRGNFNTIGVLSSLKKTEISLLGSNTHIGSKDTNYSEVNISGNADGTKVEGASYRSGSMALGASNSISIVSEIKDSALTFTGNNNTIGDASGTTNYSKVKINASGSGTQVIGGQFSSGEINVGGNANLVLSGSVTNTQIKLNGNNNTVGIAGQTNYSKTDIQASGTSNIKGDAFSSGSVNLGGSNASYGFDMTQGSRNTTISLTNTGDNIIKGSLTHSTVKSQGGVNNNTIIADSLSNSTIQLGGGNDKVNVTASSNSQIELDGGVNTLTVTDADRTDIKAGSGTDTIKVKNYNSGTLDVIGSGTTKVYAENLNSGATLNFASSNNANNLSSVGNMSGTVNLGSNMQAGVDSMTGGVINSGINNKVSVGTLTGGNINIKNTSTTLAMNDMKGGRVTLENGLVSNAIGIGTSTGGTLTGAGTSDFVLATGTPAGNTSLFGK